MELIKATLDVKEVLHEVEVEQIHELNELQLAFVGGGIGETAL